MPKPKLNRPTDSELAILRVLWHRGPSSVREVYEALGEQSGYTTVLKFMQIMTEKGLLIRNGSGRNHTYRTKESADKTQRHLIRDLLERAFGGSGKTLMMQALSVTKSSAQDLAEIRTLVEEMERKANQ
jgi:predicted transcriptional regulator